MEKLSIYANYKLSSSDKERLLRLDKKFYELFKDYKDLTVIHNKASNYDEEKNKFFDARKMGTKYFPVFHYKREPERVPDIKKRILKLIEKFGYFKNYPIYNSYFSELSRMLTHIDVYLANDYYTELAIGLETKAKSAADLDTSLLNDAYKVLKEHPYKNIESSQTKSVNDLKSEIETFCKENGINVKIKLSSKQFPRIVIEPDGTVSLKEDEKFADEDIQSILQHEINGHLMHKLEGCKHGLYIMTLGLGNSNIYYEGIAIWQALNLSKKPKKNTLPLIAAKYIIGYKLFELDFCELFDLYKELLPEASDDKIFKWLVRYKKHMIHTEITGGKYRNEIAYFDGYNKVCKMTKEEREERKKYLIGPNIEDKFEEIKKFFEINKFKPIDPKSL